MDSHAKEFYTPFSESAPHNHFHCVMPLHEMPKLSWEQLVQMVPNANKSWHELSRLKVQDRIEFTYDFWIDKLPYHPQLNDLLLLFFNSLDDIGIFVTQQLFDSPFELHLVYSLANDNGFFKGQEPATAKELTELKKTFSHCILPEDYLAFLQIHSGFSKATDTGLIPIQQMAETYRQFQQMINEKETPLIFQDKMIDPTGLIPFYESFGLSCYHCFFSEWYPEQEMGNVYYSGITHTISLGKEAAPAADKLAFSTFIDWLLFYLEKIG